MSTFSVIGYFEFKNISSGARYIILVFEYKSNNKSRYGLELFVFFNFSLLGYIWFVAEPKSQMAISISLSVSFLNNIFSGLKSLW